MSTSTPLTAAERESVNPLHCKIHEACAYIERAARASSLRQRLAIDYALIDAALAKAIAMLASARAIAITEGNLSDPAFDDGDVWDWDQEIGLPGEDYTREGKAVSP